MNILGFLRHGPTSWNREKRIQGILDIPLDHETFPVKNWQQMIHQYGPWDAVISSPLSRCQETCQLVLPERVFSLDPNLVEQDWGEWTEMTIDEIRTSRPGEIEAEEKKGWQLAPPGGEKRSAVLTRVKAAIENATRNRENQRILFITHLGVIKVLLNHLERKRFVPEDSAQVIKRGLHLIAEDHGQLSVFKKNIEIP